MSSYDNSNSGAAFQPFSESKLLLQGKMHIEDNERKIALISDTTRDGRKIIEVYQKVAVLFEEDKQGNDARPDYAGPIDDYAAEKPMRIAAWKQNKDGKNYLSLKLSERMGGGSAPSQTDNYNLNDDIPF